MPSGEGLNMHVIVSVDIENHVSKFVPGADSGGKSGQERP